MTYAEPNSGLGGARPRKIEASARLKQPLNKPLDLQDKKVAADNRAVKAEFQANQARLREEYEDAHPTPKMMPKRLPLCEHNWQPGNTVWDFICSECGEGSMLHD